MTTIGQPVEIGPANTNESAALALKNRQLEEKVLLYERILDALPWPLSVTDMDMNWTFINKPVERLLNVRRENVLGKQCSNWNANICKTKDCGIARLRGGELKTVFEQQKMNFQVDTSFIQDLNGKNIGHIEVVQDITPVVREIEYRNNWVKQHRANLKNLANGKIDLNLTMVEPDQYTAKLHEIYGSIDNDLKHVADSISGLVKNAEDLAKAGMYGNLDAREDVSKLSGDYRKIVEGMNKTLDSMVGNYEALPTPIMFIDKGLKIQYINQAGAKMLGRPKSGMKGTSCSTLWKTAKCGTKDCPCTVAMQKKELVTCENDLFVDGKHLEVVCVGVPLKDEAGAIVGAFEFVLDQTDIKTAARKALKVNEYQAEAATILTSALEVIASGDLTHIVALPESDEETQEAYLAFHELHMGIRTLKEEFGEVCCEIHRSIAQVSATSQELASSTEEMNASTEQVSAAIQQISKGAQNQAARVDEASKIMADMGTAMEAVASRSTSATEAAKKANASAVSGKVAVDNTFKKIQEIQKVVAESAKVIEALGKRSEEIGEIVGVITGISDQTNLLALNAAIEAARAGEQGRGFAVVAEEVKNLAEDSREAAERIAKMIKEVQRETSRAVEAMNRGTKEVDDGMIIVDETGKAFQEISKMAATTAEEIVTIALSMQTQREGALRAAKVVGDISFIAGDTASASEESASSTEELTASMEDMAARSQALAEMAIEMERVAGKFKTGKEIDISEHRRTPSSTHPQKQPSPEERKIKAADRSKVPPKVQSAFNKRGLVMTNK
jgi:methyl-accepting chemotaxis protein